MKHCNYMNECSFQCVTCPLDSNLPPEKNRSLARKRHQNDIKAKFQKEEVRSLQKRSFLKARLIKKRKKRAKKRSVRRGAKA